MNRWSDLTIQVAAVTIRCHFEIIGGKMVLSTVALISAAVSGIFKLLADAFDLYSQTDDVANKPNARKSFQNVKAVMNLAAAALVAYAGICQFGGQSWVVPGIFVVIVGLFVVTLGAFLIVKFKH